MDNPDIWTTSTLAGHHRCPRCAAPIPTADLHHHERWHAGLHGEVWDLEPRVEVTSGDDDALVEGTDG